MTITESRAHATPGGPQATIETFLEDPTHPVVHILTDDPEYLHWYMRKYKWDPANPQNVAFGPNHMSTTIEDASKMLTGQKGQAGKSSRMTNWVGFVKDIVLMVNCQKMIGTTGSTVTHAVQGIMMGRGFNLNVLPTIGDFPGLKEASQLAKGAIDKLTTLMKPVIHDHNDARISHEQLAVLHELLPEQLEQIHAFMLASWKNGLRAAANICETLYQQYPYTQANKERFIDKRPREWRPTQHWFGAMVAHHLNHWLLSSAYECYWHFDGTKIDLKLLATPAPSTPQLVTPSSTDPGQAWIPRAWGEPQAVADEPESRGAKRVLPRGMQLGEAYQEAPDTGGASGSQSRAPAEALAPGAKPIKFPRRAGP